MPMTGVSPVNFINKILSLRIFGLCLSDSYYKLLIIFGITFLMNAPRPLPCTIHHTPYIKDFGLGSLCRMAHFSLIKLLSINCVKNEKRLLYTIFNFQFLSMFVSKEDMTKLSKAMNIKHE